MPTSLELRDRVLIVLADEELAPTFRRAVEQATYRPRIVSTPDEARALLESGLDPCVVLFAMRTLDDGREFIRKHTADTTTATIPVIFFTAARLEATDPPTLVSALVAFVHAYCAPSRTAARCPTLH